MKVELKRPDKTVKFKKVLNKIFWARKYACCIKCGTVEFWHKGRGLCTSCWDKERLKKPERQAVRKKAMDNYIKKNKGKEEFRLKQNKRCREWQKTKKASETRKKRYEKTYYTKEYQEKLKVWNANYRKNNPVKFKEQRIRANENYKKSDKYKNELWFRRMLTKAKNINAVDYRLSNGQIVKLPFENYDFLNGKDIEKYHEFKKIIRLYEKKIKNNAVNVNN